MVSRLKRWCSHFTIAAYLGVLTFGLFAHAFYFQVASHPSMYFIVWDMFCGWNAYSLRTHLIGEGESGQFYVLGPGPWGDFHPYGNIGRQHYDSGQGNAIRIAFNTLKQTAHEPIRRVYFVEESWPKKYNLPDHIWRELHDEPKDRKSYFHLRHVYDGEGNLLSASPRWLALQRQSILAENPRLVADSRKDKPFIAVQMVRDTLQSQPMLQASYKRPVRNTGSVKMPFSPLDN